LTPLQILLVSGYSLLLAIAVVTDIATLKIPNSVSLLLAALFPAAAAVSPHPVAWVSHLAAGAVMLVAGLVLFAWGKLGGGDVKLIAAVSLWHGFHLLPSLLLLTGMLGGVLSIACLVLRRARVGVFLAAHGIPSVSLQAGADIPYAVAIASACWVLLPHLPIF
jgi:prepilin peptidase CpaA